MLTYIQRIYYCIMFLADYSGWTNSHCKSISNVYKTSTCWKCHQLLEFIDIVQKLIDGWFKDRAICESQWLHDETRMGQTLSNHLHLAGDVRFTQHTSGHGLTKHQIPGITSTWIDSTHTIPTIPGGGKKLKQQKCTTNAKTTRIKTRSHIMGSVIKTLTLNNPRKDY